MENESALPIKFDEIPIRAHTVRGDSVLSWSQTRRYLSHVAGTLDDPVFGTSSADLYWQFNLAVPPDFRKATLDSIVMSVGFDTSAVGYGQFEMPQDFEVSRIRELMLPSEDHYSDRSFMVDPIPLGTAVGVVPNSDTTFVQEPRQLQIVTNAYGPQMRVRLSDEFGNEFINFSDSVFDSNIRFQEEFMGVRLSPLSQSGGMINFEIFSPETRLNVYFTSNDTMGQYNMALSSLSVIHNRFTNDIGGTLVEEYIDNGSDNDSLLFVQAHAGPEVAITLSDLSQLEGSTINAAVLEFTVAILDPQDTTLFAPIGQMGLFEVGENGERTEIKDLADVLGGNAQSLFFGGNLDLDEDEGVLKYSMNMSQHLQKILDGEASNEMILTTLQPVAEASRSILYGPTHSKYSAKLKVTHTQF
ncbi:MAG: DUF4270 domain-containing protein [Saprospiraceae bacterium]|nr:DUF4270 domain-containing protein [Saprospiraceae bacterium]